MVLHANMPVFVSTRMYACVCLCVYIYIYKHVRIHECVNLRMIVYTCMLHLYHK